MAEWWSVDLLDANDYSKGKLGTVRSGSLEWSTFRSVQGSGSLELAESPELTPNWLADRVRIWHHDGDTATSYGVYLATRPGREVDGPVTRYTLSLSDKTQLLNQPIGRWVTYAAGTVVSSTVVGIILAAGEDRAAVEESAATLATAQSFEPSDTWLHVANELLSAIGYGSLWADRDGVLSAGPYVAPEARPVVKTYGAGEAKMLPRWSDEMDLSEIPNVVYVSAPGDETTPALIGRASNDNPADPLSTANRPEVVHSEQVEAADQAAADAIAVRRLAELQQRTRRVTMTHPLDGTWLDDVVTHPAGLTGPIVQRTIRLDIGAVVEDTVRRIYTAGEELPWT